MTEEDIPQQVKELHKSEQRIRELSQAIEMHKRVLLTVDVEMLRSLERCTDMFRDRVRIRHQIAEAEDQLKRLILSLPSGRELRRRAAVHPKRKELMMGKRQSELPGVGRKQIAEIDDLADEYVSLRDARMATLKQELEAKTALHGAMNKHGLKHYVFEHEDSEGTEQELEVVVEPAGDETVKVKKVKKTDDDDGSGDE